MHCSGHALEYYNFSTEVEDNKQLISSNGYFFLQNCPALPFEESFLEKAAPSVTNVVRVLGAGAIAAGAGALWALKSKL